MFVNVSSVDVFGLRITREYRFGVKKLNRDVARAARMLNDIFCGRETKGICVSCLLNLSGSTGITLLPITVLVIRDQ